MDLSYAHSLVTPAKRRGPCCRRRLSASEAVRKLSRQGITRCSETVRACMSLEAPMSDHWGRPGGRCVPRTSVTVILFEERPPALSVEAEEYPRARKEPAYKPGRRWCRVGGPE